MLRWALRWARFVHRVREDRLDHHRIFDARDNAYRAAAGHAGHAGHAGLDVDSESRCKPCCAQRIAPQLQAFAVGLANDPKRAEVKATSAQFILQAQAHRAPMKEQIPYAGIGGIVARCLHTQR